MQKQPSEKKTSRMFHCVVWDKDWTWPAKCPPGVLKMVGQLEQAPTTGGLHYQFFMKTDGVHRHTGAMKLLGLKQGSGRYEPCYSSEAANEEYCTKSETRVKTLPVLKQDDPIERIHPVDWILGTPSVRRAYCIKSYDDAYIHFILEKEWFKARPALFDCYAKILSKPAEGAELADGR